MITVHVWVYYLELGYAIWEIISRDTFTLQKASHSVI